MDAVLSRFPLHDRRILGELVADVEAIEFGLCLRGRIRAVEPLHERAGQRPLGVARAGSGRGSDPISSEYHSPIDSSGMLSVFPYISSGGSATPM